MRVETLKDCKRGFTIIEVIVVVSIVATLAFIAIGSFREMIDKYQVESKTKEMFSAIMEARGRALQRSRVTFVRLVDDPFHPSGVMKRYEVYEDTIPAPDGDGLLDTTAGGDRRVFAETLKHTIEAPFASADLVSALETRFRFQRNGLSNASGYIRVLPRIASVRPDYDCIVVGQTRVKMGQFDPASGGRCVEK